MISTLCLISINLQLTVAVCSRCILFHQSSSQPAYLVSSWSLLPPMYLSSSSPLSRPPGYFVSLKPHRRRISRLQLRPAILALIVCFSVLLALTPVPTLPTVTHFTVPETPPALPKFPAAYAAVQPLLRKYQQSRLSNPPTTKKYILFRALGNDLPPRHATNQTTTNLAFILKNEPRLPQLERRWYINRIVDPNKLLHLVKTLIAHNETFTIDYLDASRLFESGDMNFEGFGAADILRSPIYQVKGRILDFMMHDLNLFVINNNGARNAMIDLAFKANATYVLPWDGNCYLNKRAWIDIRLELETNERRVAKYEVSNDTAKYFTVPMARMTENQPLKDPDFRPRSATEEPQIIFHKSAKERFNLQKRYGDRPKVDLLYRLGVPGVWDTFRQYGQFDTYIWKPSDDVPRRGAVRSVGWVARLFSGMKEMEVSGGSHARGESRTEGVERIIAKVAERHAIERYDFNNASLLIYDDKALRIRRRLYQEGNDTALNKLVQQLIKTADKEIKNKAKYSVMSKTLSPRSGDFHDYFSPWGATLAHRDLEMASTDPAEVLKAKVILKRRELRATLRIDYLRLSNCFRNLTVLALAGFFTGEWKYSRKSADQVRMWFINPNTRMNPNINFARCDSIAGHSYGSSSGLNEVADLPFVLDAFRLLHRAKALSDDDMSGLWKWMRKYTGFLNKGLPARRAYFSSSRLGPLFDLHSASVGTFLGDFPMILRHTSLARGRMFSHFGGVNIFGHLLKPIAGDDIMIASNNRSMHDATEELLIWATLSLVSERVGINMWRFTSRTRENRDGSKDPMLKLAVKAALPYFARKSRWDFNDNSDKEPERWLYLYYLTRNKYRDLEETKQLRKISKKAFPIPKSVYEVQPMFKERLIPPFWNLGMALSD